MEDPLQLALLECFKLGQALRAGDADAFCEVYDSLLHADQQGGGENLQFKFSAVKEAARQISELSEEDYFTLECSYTTIPVQSPDFSLDIYEPIAIQLSGLIDQLRVERGWTSDSGALSDYESSICETDGMKSGSNSMITLCGEERELSKELEELGEVQTDDGMIAQLGEGSTVEEGQREDSMTDAETITPSPTPAEQSLSSYEQNGRDEQNESEDKDKQKADNKQNGGQIEQVPSSIDTAEAIVAPLSDTTSIPESTAETPRNGQSHTFEDKERDIGEILSKIKSMSPEELPSCSRTDKTPEKVQSSNNDVILVSDLEKELFSDLSEDNSPEKRAEEAAGSQHQGRYGVQKPQTSHYENSATEGVGRGGPRWQKHNPHYGYNRRGFRHRRGGFRSHRGRDRYDRAKENDNTAWVQNGSHMEENQNCEGEAWPLKENKGHRDKFPDDDRASLEKKGRHSGQPSPLVHNQNMWSSRRGRYRQCRRYEKASNTFNHHEVGCFLLEGWEQAKKELAANCRAAS